MVSAITKRLVPGRFFRPAPMDPSAYLAGRSVETAGLMTGENDLVERIERLRDDPDALTPSFQGVLVATLAFVDRVRDAEFLVAAASLSLAQRDAMAVLLAETSVMAGALRSLVARPPTVTPHVGESGGSWWYALAEATQAIETSIDRMSNLVSAQPKGGAVRPLVTEVMRVFRGHHRQLMGEATRWIEG